MGSEVSKNKSTWFIGSALLVYSLCYIQIVSVLFDSMEDVKRENHTNDSVNTGC